MKLKLLTLTFFLLAAGAWAQQSVLDTHPKHLFETGKSLFEAKNYPAASRCLEDALHTGAFAGTETERQAHNYVALSAFYQQKDDAAHLLEAYAEHYPYASNIEQVQLYIGILELEEGKNKPALNRFEKIRLSQLDAQDGMALQYYRGVAYSKQKKYDKAAYELGQLLKSGAGSYQENATYYYGYAQYQLGNYTEALASLKQIENTPAFKQHAPFLICQLYFLQDNCEKATEYGSKLLEVKAAGTKSERQKAEKQKAEIMRIMGTCAFRNQQYQQAATYLEDYQKITQRISREDWYLLGMAYYQLQQYDKAITALSKTTAKKVDRLTQNAYYHIALSNLQLGNKAKARMAFEQASNADFDKNIQEDALYNYALVTYEMSYQPFNESIGAFERFLKEFPNSKYKDKVHGYMVNAYLTTNNYEEAYASIKKLNSKSAQVKEAEQRVLFGMATNAIANRQYPAAMQHLETLLAQKISNTDIKARAQFWYGECLYRNGKYADARSYFDKYLKTTTSRMQAEYNLAYYNTAYTYFSEKQYTASNQWFRQYVGMEKENMFLLLDAYNRIGDAYFQQRDFTHALQAYNSSIEKGGTSVGADYAMYQTAFVYGLQGKYSDKIARLNNLLQKFPKSNWADDAYYEIGRSQVSLNQNNEAMKTFEGICSKYPKNSDVVRQSRAQLAMLQYNEGMIDQSIATHKLIIAQYPNSEEAATSFTTLESMMVDHNRVDEYNQLAQQLGKSSVTQEDSLQYKAVEKIYFRDELPAAITGFEKYLKAYPQGKYRSLATYYLANCYYRQNQNDSALNVYRLLVKDAQNPNMETTLARAASLAYDAGKYQEAATYFEQLHGIGNAEHKQAAALGMLRCWNLLNQYNKTIDAANDLIEAYAGNADMVAEARYNRMKAYVALNKVDEALPDIKALATDTRSEAGAEAKYRLAQYYLTQNNLDKAEAEVFDYIEKGTTHQHWLAKSFVVLADVYLAKENYFEAKQYLLSLKDNYDTTNDAEVAEDIATRLQKIESIENETVSNN